MNELKNFRAKYPQYNDLDDATLGNMLAEKYPDAYGDLASKPIQLPGTQAEISQAMLSQFNQQSPTKLFEQVASLNQGYTPGDGKPREGAGLASKIARTGLNTTGIVAGSILGTGGSPGVGTIAGGSLGYAAGEKIADKVDEFLGLREPQSLKDEFIDTAKQLKTGAEYELGGQVLGPAVGRSIDKAFKAAQPVIEMTGKYVFDTLPQRLYGGAVKLPLSAKWVKKLPGREISKRTAAVEEGLRSKIPPSEFGIAKAENLEREISSFINDVTNVLSTDPKNKIQVAQLIDNGLIKAYSKASKSSDPIGSKKIVDKVAKKFKAHGEYLTPFRANEIKRELYKEVKWGNDIDRLTESSVKGIANKIMTSLEKIYPEIKKTNQTYAARLSLIEALERAVGRNANRDMVGLGTKVLASHPKTWPLAIWESTVGHPQVKSQIAFLLAKGNPRKYSQFIYPEKPLGYIPPSKIAESVKYKYTPVTNFAKATRPNQLNVILREGEKPKEIIKKSTKLRQKEEYERLKNLERIFKEAEIAKSLKGSPLITPSGGYSRSARPISVNDRLKITKAIKNPRGLMGYDKGVK